jgi:hypothetical protein
MTPEGWEAAVRDRWQALYRLERDLPARIFPGGRTPPAAAVRFLGHAQMQGDVLSVTDQDGGVVALYGGADDRDSDDLPTVGAMVHVDYPGGAPHPEVCDVFAYEWTVDDDDNRGVEYEWFVCKCSMPAFPFPVLRT